MEDKLRKLAEEFLLQPDAECFIGYEEGPSGSVRPVFIRRPEEVHRLVWNQKCFANLTTYLPDFHRKNLVVGIVVKGCDARALRELIRAHQIDRHRIYVVGLPCEGLVTPEGDVIAERCYGCVFPESFKYDTALGPMKTPDRLKGIEHETLDDLSPMERRKFWELEFEKCIRCDACREICYACFCPECILESTQPRWLSRRQNRGEKLFFHSVRALHLVGRCIGCGECERACPAGVRLMLLNRYLQKQLEDLFGYRGAGILEDASPLLTSLRDDPDPFAGGFE